MDSRYKIEYTSKAEQDYWEILLAIQGSDKDPFNKAKLMVLLTSSIDSLDFMPERYRIYEEVTQFGKLRTFVVDNRYRVLYLVDNNKMLVTIFRIVYAKALNRDL